MEKQFKTGTRVKKNSRYLNDHKNVAVFFTFLEKGGKRWKFSMLSTHHKNVVRNSRNYHDG